MSTDTEFFTKRPVFKYVLDALLKRIETAIVAGIIIVYQQYHVKNQIWNETGPHFQDLVKGEQALQATNSLQQKKETK